MHSGGKKINMESTLDIVIKYVVIKYVVIKYVVNKYVVIKDAADIPNLLGGCLLHPLGLWRVLAWQSSE